MVVTYVVGFNVIIYFFCQKTRKLTYKIKGLITMTLEKSLVTKISESGNEMGTSEILDHVIAIQLDKIERTYKNNARKISESSEKAMENMIRLLEIRYSRKG